MSAEAKKQADTIWGPFEFSGILSLGTDSTDVTFQASMDRSGHLSLEFLDLPITNQSRFILLNFSANDHIVHFTIDAANDLRTLHSTKLYITSLSTDGTLRFSARCKDCKIRVILREPRERHSIRYWLCGFRTVCGLKRDTPLGTLYIGGQQSVDDFTAMTGQLALESRGSSLLTSENAIAVRDLLEHVVFIMSFASGTFLRVPLKELQTETYLETETLNVSRGAKPYLPPIHHLQLESIFDAAVASHKSLDHVKGLRVAIEWLLTPTTYNEIALLSRMTALEHLIGQNLDKPKNALSSEQKLSLRTAVEHWLAASDLSKDLCDEIRGKFGNVAMPTFESRIQILLKKWEVPLNNLPDNAIKGIVAARNKVVHRGTYYGNDVNDGDKLWTHVTVAQATVSKNQWKYVADLELDLDPGLPRILSNAGELSQVFINLIVNAAHAIEDKGDREHKGAITIRTRAGGDSLTCSISDTGVGISPHNREKIFDLFFTTKAPGRGTGQGLSLVHTIVTKSHGGQVSVQSTVGEGTTFTITLPLEPKAK